MTKERIWRLDEDGAPTPLSETAFDDESALQELIAEYPDVLAGERITPNDPRRWLLISREMGVPDSQDSADRWAVDHLLVDQDARPTLGEVKRGDNSEIRRRVVGQMLDYAAHATRYWTADTIRDRLESESGGEDAARARIAQLRGVGGEPAEDAYEDFWERVDRNLDAENMCLLIVADDVPDDLATVVGFLNRHMAPRVEVLAVELKQFRGECLRTLVPRVMGRSGSPHSGTARRRTRHTREPLLAEFREGSTREAARKLLDRAGAAGALFEFGPSGVSIRARCPARTQPVTIAWLFPPGAGGWMRTRDFSFGAFIIEGYEPPPAPALVAVLERYIASFASDPWAHGDASSKGVTAWRVGPEDAADHADTLASRVETVLRELATLPPIVECGVNFELRQSDRPSGGPIRKSPTSPLYGS